MTRTCEDERQHFGRSLTRWIHPASHGAGETNGTLGVECGPEADIAYMASGAPALLSVRNRASASFESS
jgi:hypothetical protein